MNLRINSSKLFWGILLLALAFTGKSFALEARFNTDKVSATILTESNMIHPNQPFDLLVKFDMTPGWHIFAQNPGDIGRPTTVSLDLPEGYTSGEGRWSLPEKFDTDGIIQYGYAKTAYYRVKITPIGRPEKKIEIGVNVFWQACKDECIPERFSKTLQFDVSNYNQLPGKVWQQENAQAEKSFSEIVNSDSQAYSLWLILLMAFAGGIILNFMPCIFPILTIKAISLVQGDHKNIKAMRWESLLYSLGVVLSFLIIASVLVFLRAQGEHIGWGFQLQSPIFVATILVIFIIVFLMLLDIISIRNPFANKVGRISMSKRKINAFVTGFFAVLIASPCTGPFMGIAIGYTLTQPIYIYFPVFLALSIGYALPFALVGFFPKLLFRILPKPGKWMDILKKIFAIPVFLTCLWLAWLLHNQTNAASIEEIDKMQWGKYDPAVVDQLVAKGEPVLVDFTAKWCITCLANERFVLQSAGFAELVKKRGIHIFKADWTNENPNITMALAFYGRNSIPLYVYYDGQSKHYIILPQILTMDIVREALKE